MCMQAVAMCASRGGSGWKVYVLYVCVCVFVCVCVSAFSRVTRIVRICKRVDADTRARFFFCTCVPVPARASARAYRGWRKKHASTLQATF